MKSAFAENGKLGRLADLMHPVSLHSATAVCFREAAPRHERMLDRRYWAEHVDRFVVAEGGERTIAASRSNCSDAQLIRQVASHLMIAPGCLGSGESDVAVVGRPCEETNTERPRLG